MAVALGASTLLLAACGSDSASIATTDSAVPVTLGQLDDVVLTVPTDVLTGERIVLRDTDGDGEMEVLEAEPAPLDQTDAASEPATPEPAEESTDDGLNPLGGDDPEDKRMPDVVCMGLQRAQDEIQDRGVFFSKSVDATGEGRRQLWDRNWIVVSQDPEAGEPIGENEAVLSVVKTDEDNPC
ncbi:MAG: PASTA domain-containing protein [Ilumatobacter sp.]